jgi:hypothetical protein
MSKNRKLWVVWRSDTGITARKRSPAGKWKKPIQVIDSQWPPFFDAGIVGGELYVVADQNNGEIYQLDDGEFELIEHQIFPEYEFENDEYMEAEWFSHPAIEINGGILRIAASRSYYFEDFNTGEDEYWTSTVVWVDGEIEKVVDYSWNNVGGKFISGWLAGGGNKVFVAEEID